MPNFSTLLMVIGPDGWPGDGCGWEVAGTVRRATSLGTGTNNTVGNGPVSAEGAFVTDDSAPVRACGPGWWATYVRSRARVLRVP
jgi:hypothetical protein